MPKVCRQVQSTRGYEQFVHVNAVPKARKWTDARVGGKIVTIQQTIKNDTYEVSIGISADDYDDDQVNAYSPIVQEMMVSLLLAPDELITTNLILQGEDATNGVCYDGLTFYNVAHVWPNAEYATAQLNKQTGTGYAYAQEIEADFFTALAAIEGWKDDRGRARIPPQALQDANNLLVHYPTAFRQVFKSVFGTTPGGEAYDVPAVAAGTPTTTTLTAPTKSKAADMAQLYADPYLTGHSWYIHVVGGLTDNLRPFVFQNREAPHVSVFARGSEHYEKFNEVLFLGKRRFGLGFSRPECSQKVYNA
jgi:phage major head subunit gpT-like protein